MMFRCMVINLTTDHLVKVNFLVYITSNLCGVTPWCP